MKPYKIKHKASGLYYQPLSNGDNLSKSGKVYLTKSCVLDGTGPFVHICLSKLDIIYREYGNFFLTLSPHYLYMAGRVPKTEFEIEEL